MRSGSTLLSNILSGQKGVLILPDFLHIARIKNAIGCNSLTDYMDNSTRLKAITELDKNCNVITKATGYKFKLNIKAEDFNNLLDFYNFVLNQEQFNSHQVIGHKTTESESIVSELLNHVDDLKCIHLIRDPRDVLVSNKKMFNQNSITVLKNWKTGFYHIQNITKNENVLTIKYEDLISNPKSIFNKIKLFVGIDDIDLNHEIQWYGNKFQENSSFNDVTKLFDSSGIGRWKKSENWINILAKIMIKNEMKHLGYEVKDSVSLKNPPIYFKYFINKTVLSAQSIFLYSRTILRDLAVRLKISRESFIWQYSLALYLKINNAINFLQKLVKM